MPHLSRLFATSCAITVILFSLPTDAGIGEKDLPLLVAQKTKLLYTVVGVTNWNDLATSFHCTSTERSGGKTIHLGVEVFDNDGNLLNNIAIGEGDVFMSPGRTVTLSTRAVLAFVSDEIVDTGVSAQGSARIFATSKNVLCSAMIVDAVNATPTSMVMLPVFRAAKQKGM